MCLCDGAASEVGGLCRSCAKEVPPPDGLIQEHIRSTVSSGDEDAWLIDGFGQPHAVAPKSTIGRNHEGQIVVLSASVSREHAELKKSDAGWTIRDLGSRNGTTVDGAKCQGRVALPARCIIKVGDVPMWFLSEVVEEPASPPSMETKTEGGALLRYVISTPDNGPELCLIGNNDSTSGGALLTRATGTPNWGNDRELPPLEFQLLRALCARACAEASSPAAARGCVPTKQLASDLDFKTRYANEENVRQVVRRLRGQLAELGADKILSVVPGRGYYLTCPVTSSGAAGDRR